MNRKLILAVIIGIAIWLYFSGNLTISPVAEEGTYCDGTIIRDTYDDSFITSCLVHLQDCQMVNGEAKCVPFAGCDPDDTLYWYCESDTLLDCEGSIIMDCGSVGMTCGASAFDGNDACI